MRLQSNAPSIQSFNQAFICRTVEEECAVFERIERALESLLCDFESTWRQSPLEESKLSLRDIRQLKVSTIRDALMTIGRRDPGAVRMVTLHCFAGLEVSDVAKTMKRPTAEVQDRIAIALAALEVLLQQHRWFVGAELKQ